MKVDSRYFLVEPTEAGIAIPSKSLTLVSEDGEKEFKHGAKRLKWDLFRVETPAQQANYFVSLTMLLIHISGMLFGYNYWANYNYFLIANSVQLSTLFIILSKIQDPTYFRWIVEHEWLVWTLVIFNLLLFIGFLSVGIFMYVTYKGVIQYFSVSLLTFELFNRVPLFCAIISSYICSTTKNFFPDEKYYR
jgi:hypothetical protein